LPLKSCVLAITVHHNEWTANSVQTAPFIFLWSPYNVVTPTLILLVQFKKAICSSTFLEVGEPSYWIPLALR
jgi:hypothetical protein